jgi:peroxiredoxin
MEAIVLAILIVLLVLNIAGWTLLYQMVKQQGRLLLRIDALEEHLLAALEAVTVASTPTAPIQSHGPHIQENPPEAAPQGFAVGTPLPSFRLPDLRGRMTSLDDYRGKKVLLVHWSTQCGFCDMIAVELAGLEADLERNNVQPVFISYGDADANLRAAAEYKLHAPILLQKPGETIEAFEGFGTPVAYLLDEEGRVAAPLSIGADRVPELVREVAGGKRLPGKRSLAESRIERDGLGAGTPAPGFQLPDLHGQKVSLEEFRGRRLLLVFSDPNCGPCDELAPDLVQLHRKHLDNNLAVVMIGRGDPDENRRKAKAHGIEFPVLLQEKWKLSKEYGIFATPVAFLIDENGVITKNVAKGANEILSLVPED